MQKPPRAHLVWVEVTRCGLVADLHDVYARLGQPAHRAPHQIEVEVPIVAQPTIADGAVQDFHLAPPVGHQAVRTTANPIIQPHDRLLNSLYGVARGPDRGWLPLAHGVAHRAERPEVHP